MAASAAEMKSPRRLMVEHQIRVWDVFDENILQLLEELPREDFVPAVHHAIAFADTKVPLGDGQVMMEPKVEARMLQALDVKPTDSILEIGTGSGFVTACLASLGHEVTSCDIRKPFLAATQDNLKKLELDDKVELLEQDSATLNWTDRRFDVICVTGSMPLHDPGFAEHLNIGGRLFVIEGQAPAMEALLLTRISEKEWDREGLFETVLPRLDNVAVPSKFEF